jgi:hypothetical protein
LHVFGFSIHAGAFAERPKSDGTAGPVGSTLLTLSGFEAQGRMDDYICIRDNDNGVLYMSKAGYCPR